MLDRSLELAVGEQGQPRRLDLRHRRRLPENRPDLRHDPLQAAGDAQPDGLLQRVAPRVGEDLRPSFRQEVDLITLTVSNLIWAKVSDSVHGPKT
jgi:hypothetical protein